MWNLVSSASSIVSDPLRFLVSQRIMLLHWLLFCACSRIAVLAVAEQYTNEWAVKLQGIAPEQVDALAEKHGFVNYGKIGNIDSMYRFVYAGESLKQFSDQLSAGRITSDPQVVRIHRQLGKERVKKDYQVPRDSSWRRQWSLKNTGQTNGPKGYDLKVEGAWLQGITGKGVLVGVVDDGLQWNHPDIIENYDSLASHDFVHNDGDPTPDPSNDEPNSHGTGCAGEIAMVNNTLCGIGVAYQSNVASLKIDLSSSTADSEEASALGHLSDAIMVYSNSWGPSDYGFFVDGPGELTEFTFSTGAQNGRGGKGSIYVWAAGNGGRNYDSCAADGYVNSIYTIAVGSADQNGHQADYDESCTAKIAVTYSYNSDTFPTQDDSWSAYNQITTLDLNSGCTDGFTGTSASTPLVSATIALVLQVNSDLTWRDIQYLIIYTSDTTKLSGDWIINGAGLKVSSQFGFGAIDAEAIVTRARHWIRVPQQLKLSIPSYGFGFAQYYSIYRHNILVSEPSIRYLEHVVLTVSLSISLSPYDVSYDYSDFFNRFHLRNQKEFGDLLENNKTIRVKRETAYEFLTADHARRGDIKVELISPMGTKSVLLPYREFDFVNAEGYDSWPFMSLHHWGENPIGNWIVQVTYNNIHAKAYVIVEKFEIYGTSVVPEAISQIPIQCDPACDRGCSGIGADNCDVCSALRDSQTLQCVNECPEDATKYNNYCINHHSSNHHDDHPSNENSPSNNHHPSNNKSPSSKYSYTSNHNHRPSKTNHPSNNNNPSSKYSHTSNHNHRPSKTNHPSNNNNPSSKYSYTSNHHRPSNPSSPLSDDNSSIPSFVLPLAISFAVFIVVAIATALFVTLGVFVCIKRKKHQRSVASYKVLPSVLES